MTRTAQLRRTASAASPTTVQRRLPAKPEPMPPGGTLAERLRLQLERQIVSGQLRPGSRLDEAAVAERYGVSRTPVREAIRMLAASQLVEVRGRQGVVVRSIATPMLIEMFTVMAELEGLCARLAARRVNAAQLAQLRAIHTRLEQAAGGQDADTFYDINQEFHEAVYDASRNAFLATQTRTLRNQVAPYRRRVTRMPGRMADTLVEHQAVIDAIAAHDAERAGQAMRGHVNLLGDDLLDFIAMPEET